MSSFSFFSSAGSIFFVGVRVRLNLPAVIVEKATPSRFSRSYTLGCAVDGAQRGVWVCERVPGEPVPQPRTSRARSARREGGLPWRKEAPPAR